MAASRPPDVDAVDEIVSQWRRQWPDLDVSPLQVFGRLHRTYLRYQASLAALFDQHGINMCRGPLGRSSRVTQVYRVPPQW